jgi:hypothetical protein
MRSLHPFRASRSAQQLVPYWVHEIERVLPPSEFSTTLRQARRFFGLATDRPGLLGIAIPQFFNDVAHNPVLVFDQAFLVGAGA